MEIDSIKDIKSVCLSCLNCTNDYVSLQDTASIDELGETKKVDEMLMECTSVQIVVDGIQTDKICADCFVTLTQFYKYRQQVIKSTEYLKNLAGGQSVQEYVVQEDLLQELIENQPPTDDSTEDEFLETKSIVRLNCDLCNQNFTDRIQRLEHFCNHAKMSKFFQNQEEGNNYYCQACPKLEITDDKVFHQHLTDHDDNDFDTSILGAFSCKKCLLSFKTKKQLSIHVTLHPQVVRPIYNCLICSAEFTERLELRIHIRDHADVIICRKCGEICPNVEMFEDHKQVHVKTTVCEHCGKVLSPYRLPQHMESFHLPKSNFCPICNKAYASKHKLIIHKRSHSESEMFACSVPGCKTRCTTLTYLRKHEKFHTDARPYVCEREGCTKTFKTSSALGSHLLSHTGEKKFGCDLCFKRFSRGTLLKNHLKVHANQRPFKCEYCESTFRRRWNMNFHMKNMHKDKIGDQKKADVKVETENI